MTTEELDRYITQEILSHKKRFYDIEGAPFQIGNHVVVLDNPNNDSTFDTHFVGLSGSVVYFEYDCGCGQTFPTDPMIGVHFANGSIEEFWKEELVLTDQSFDTALCPRS